MENEMELSALTDLESTTIQCQQSMEKEKELVKDLEIYLAKLNKHREVLARKEEELAKARMLLMELADKKIKENRLELEGKLDKMKVESKRNKELMMLLELTDKKIKENRLMLEGKLEKMKRCYTEEISKAKEKHKRELFLVKSENRQLLEKNDRYESHLRQISKQLYQLNDRQLALQKENEILKNKLRISENNPPATLMYPPSSLASNFPTGREYVRFSELQLRNSLVPPHLHSTYSAQYDSWNLKEEDISETNENGKTFNRYRSNPVLSNSQFK